MKSSHTSISPFRRALVAATVVLATGSVAAIAQSATQDTSSSPSSSKNSSYGSNANNSSGSMQNNSNDMSGNRMSSSNNDSSDYNSNSSSMRGSSSDKLSWSDKRFVTKAADGGQDEVAIAQLATEKANNPDVREFAQKLVQDHTQVNSELMSIASTKNVKIDKDDSTKDRTYRRLSKASGQDFDREFVEHMVDEHEKDIKMFEKAASNAKDPEIREFASKHIDHLRQHLAQAQQLQQSIVPTGRSDRDSWKSQSSSGSSSNTGLSGHSTNAGATRNSSFDTSSGSSAGSTSSNTSTVR